MVTTRAATQVDRHTLVMREYDLPEIGDDDGLLEIERCGLCGSDVEQFEGHALGGPDPTSHFRYPTIPGHEPLGRIVELGERAAARWNVSVGDRVIVEAMIRCGSCANCQAARGRLCMNRRTHGFVSTEVSPGLWGGYAQHMYLPPTTVVHKVSASVPADLAVLFNPLAAGIDWAVDRPGLRSGESILVMGAGQRGLASVIAARAAEAGTIIATGLTRDAHKLEVAKALGADVVVDVERDDLTECVRDATAGIGPDVVVDVVPGDTQVIVDAVDVARRGARIVLAGTKGGRTINGLSTDKVADKDLTLIGVVSKSTSANQRAINVIESGAFDLAQMHTHTFLLDEAEHAVRTLAGQYSGENAICVSLAPNGL